MKLTPERMAALEAMTLTELASEIYQLKLDLEARKAEQAEEQKLYDFITIGLVPDKMDEEGITSINIKGIGRLQCSADIRCSCPKANRVGLEDWLADNGFKDLITSTVNASTLKAFIKEQMKADKPIPDDLLSITPYSRATVVKT